ncbi:MAG: extracellular solute-binding protein, partial [Clostridia bacterium]|nr:extracellular solute-binding protein [Clostridia bacterium]
ICIIYNTTMVDPEDDIETWDILWNEKYANNILMFSNSRDAFALACKKLGYSMNTESESELTAAAEALKDQKMLVQAYVMDEIYDKMGGGEAALAPYYAGDALVMMEDNPDLDVVFPREGTNLFDDALCIPKGAKNKEAAELYINFVTETLVSRENSLFIGYATPQQLSYEAMDDETKENTVIYPTPDMIENDEVYVALSDTATKLMDSLWTNILSETNISPWMTPVLLVAVLGLTVFINVRRQVKKHRKSEAK